MGPQDPREKVASYPTGAVLRGFRVWAPSSWQLCGGMQQGLSDQGGAASVTHLCFLLGGQRGCSWPPRCLLPPQRAPYLSGHPYLEEPDHQLALCGTPAREATGCGVGAASPGLWLIGQCPVLDTDSGASGEGCGL